MNYNLLNAHVRDRRLHFDAGDHTYSVDAADGSGTIQCESVTTIVDSLFEKFDADYWAARKATPEKTAEMLKTEWEENARRASELGSQLHDRVERHYLGEEPEPDALCDPAFRNFLAFNRAWELVPFRSEWRIFSEKFRVAGTLDFLERRNGVFNLWDWKRSSKVVNAFGQPLADGFRGKCGTSRHIAHIPDTSYWHYALQLSLYRYILECEYDIRVRKAMLGIFHPCYDRPWVAEVPYLRDEAIAILNSRI